MIKLKINEFEFFIKDGISILEACQFAGIQIPRFCYHEALSIAGNCRMCLVKLEENDNLIISCLTRVKANLEIFTEDPSINKAREEIIEFLLLNHPLDCPICDQGGECDLQDQTKIFGSVNSKYYFNKTTVEDKFFNTFIKSIMTRCIHCTRCVRFSSEIAGLEFFGTLNRGHSTEIGIYDSNFFASEISGNVIDLCPVGALTSKSYAFRARPWELRVGETLDLTDSLGSNIYINSTELRIARILPKFNEQINQSIISDKARYSYDAFESNIKLDNLTFSGIILKKPANDIVAVINQVLYKNDITNLIFKKVNKNYFFNYSNLSRLKNSDISDSFAINFSLKNFIKCSSHFLFIINDELSLELIHFFKKLELIIAKNNNKKIFCTFFGSSISLLTPFQFSLRKISFTDINNSSNLFINKINKFSNLYNSSNNCFLFAFNPRTEVTLINTRIRYLTLHKFFNVYSIGYQYNSTLKTIFLNFNILKFLLVLEGKCKILSNLIIKESNSLLFFGSSLLKKGFKFSFLEFFFKTLNPSLNLFKSFLYSNSTGVLFMGIENLNSKDILFADLIFFVNCKETSFLRRLFYLKNLNTKFVWLNTHKSENILKYGLNIPLKSYFEETGTFCNLEFRPQQTQKVINSQQYNFSNNISLFNSLFSYYYDMSKSNYFIKSEFLFFISELTKDLSKFDSIKQNNYMQFLSIPILLNEKSIITTYPFKPEIQDFFLTSNFTLFSKNMLLASQIQQKKFNNFF